MWEIWTDHWTEYGLNNKAGRREIKLRQEPRFWKGGYETFDEAKREAARLAITHGQAFFVQLGKHVEGDQDGDRRVSS